MNGDKIEKKIVLGTKRIDKTNAQEVLKENGVA
jgi:hypothetical protein